MKILHITRQFYPCIGGTEKYVYEVAKRLVKRGYENYVLTLNYNIFNKKQKFKSNEEIDGIKIIRIPGFGYYKKPFPLKIPLKVFEQVNIVHLHDIRFLFETAIFLKRFFNYKLVYSTHGFLFHTTDLYFVKKLVVPLYYKPLIKKFVDSIICVSQNDYNYFKKFTNKAYLIENGIDYEKFSNINCNPIKENFLYFGRIDTNKGLDLLFNVLAKLKDIDWRLNIVGGGFSGLIESLKMLAKQLGIDKKIIWWGFLPESKLFDLISESQICFFPSTYEGFGFTLIEAMAAGCVCVANNIEAYRCIIDDEKNGFIINFTNVDTASEKIKNILNMPKDKLEKVSQQAKITTKRYDWEEKIERIIKVYDYVM
ncbi:MAG: glycosyltransferase family 4 protein [Candidatus Aenigmatarchaeota archaeon]